MPASFRNIFVAMSFETDEPDTCSAIPFGLSLAHHCAAQATVLAASLRLALSHAFVSGLAADLVATENRRLDGLARAAADEARTTAERAGVAGRFESPQLSYGALLDAVVSRARVHDLTVLDAENVTVTRDRGLIEAALFKSGRPLIVVPAGTGEFRSRRILVAWDGSARAARAVNDAMPLLQMAELVEIISVQGEKDLADAVPGADLAQHLACHGVRCSVVDLDSDDGDVAAALSGHAVGTGADMIVMGAYVHSWLREVVLGGVTQALLGHARVPLFLSY